MDEVIDPVKNEEDTEPATIAAEETVVNPFTNDDDNRTSVVARAVDEIVANVYESLSLKPVLVVWLFDATTSAESVRREAAVRLARNCDILAGLPADQRPENEVHWAALAFGQKIELLVLEPTGDIRDLVTAMDSIAEDNSGVENTFAAIDKAADEWVPEDGTRDRYVFFVVVTDEAGDDAERVDAVAARLKKRLVQTYVIGPAAPFGYEGSLTPVAEIENWRAVRQGPESRELELVDVTAGGRSQAAALMDSGCGPFALSYITLSTDGQFFIFHHHPATTPLGVVFSPATENVRFDTHVVARYLPEYVSAEEYRRLQNGSRARSAMNQAARLPHIALAADVKREFAANDPAAWKRLLDEAQRSVARIEPRLKQFYDTLAAGEDDRDRLPPRWQANYDLAMGRVMAARARLEGYNAMLARLKTNNTFRQPGGTRWVLVDAEAFASDSALNKLAHRAHEYLQRVVSTHSGTPWAWLAEHELKAPMAWNWVEK